MKYSPVLFCFPDNGDSYGCHWSIVAAGFWKNNLLSFLLEKSRNGSQGNKSHWRLRRKSWKGESQRRGKSLCIDSIQVYSRSLNLHRENWKKLSTKTENVEWDLNCHMSLRDILKFESKQVNCSIKQKCIYFLGQYWEIHSLYNKISKISRMKLTFLTYQKQEHMTQSQE